MDCYNITQLVHGLAILKCNRRFFFFFFFFFFNFIHIQECIIDLTLKFNIF